MAEHEKRNEHKGVIQQLIVDIVKRDPKGKK